MKYAHNTDVDILFYNDRILEAIPASEIAEPFTYVPIKAGHEELVGGNVMVFGSMTEGYPIQPIDCGVELTSASVLGTYSEMRFPINGKVAGQGNSNWKWVWWWAIVVTLPKTIIVGAIYTISIKNPSWGSPITASYTAVLGDTTSSVRNELLNALTILGAETRPNDGVNTNEIYLYNLKTAAGENDNPTNPFVSWSLVAGISISDYIIKNPQLKRGAKHGFGVVYKDEWGRQNSVSKSDNLILNIPFYDEKIYYGGAVGAGWMDSDLDTLINPIFSINNKPPLWAKYYEIVYCGNFSMEQWLQIRAKNITNLTNHRYSLDIQSTIDEIRATNPRWTVPDWSWLAGDRLRLIGSIDDTSGAVTRFQHPYDYALDALYGGLSVGGAFLFQATNNPFVLPALSNNMIVEVYRPSKGLRESVFYGSGMVFGIGVDAYGNRYHKGDVDQVFDQNGLLVTPARIHNTAFDSWKFMRLNYKEGDINTIHPFWAESDMPSDWWTGLLFANKITSNGFPFLYDVSQKQSILTKRLRHGGSLLPGTQINDIAHFTYNDFIDMSEKDGDITGLREIGYTLKVLQFHKETSIYINRIQTFNPDGTEQFTLVDRLLGSVRPEETTFGTQHPDSVLLEGRNLYYWDNIEAEVIRSSPNGQEPISGPKYKVSRWFKDLGKWIRENGGAGKLKVRFGFNVDHNELWCSFVIDDTVYGIVFSEAQGRWITRINNVTDAYVHAGEFFAHLYNQKMWVLNIDKGQDYLSWGGVQVDAEIEFVSNIDPKKNKVFNSIAVYSDHEMEIPSGYIRIPAEASSSLMESFVALWEEKEGIFYGAILKDIDTPGAWDSVDDVAMNGNEMRGRYCFVKMKTSIHTEKVRLDSVIVFSTPSERNV